VRPLDGITVVALEHAVAAPFCTRQLADLGARVIKIERPGGGDFARAYDDRVRGLSSSFVWLNRSKESLTLDVKHPKARAILDKLLAQADVLVQNLAPGAAARLGLSYDALKETYPRLIVCDVSGYGDVGPYRNKKAYDLLIQAEAGLLSLTGTPDTPSRAGLPVVDVSAGMYAYSNVLAALIARGKTGRGCRIDVALFETAIEWLSFPLYFSFDGAPQPPRTGSSHAAVYPYGPFPAGDGKIVMLGLQNEREWKTFCEKVLLNPELVADKRFDSNPKRVTSRQELDAIIIQAFAGLTADDVVARLDAAGIANARMNGMHDVWVHPQLKARGRWTEVDTPAGKIPALRPPGVPENVSVRMDPVPAVGQHTDAILREMGYDAAVIDELRTVGAI
jgi:itaconate CoA-transferase